MQNSLLRKLSSMSPPHIKWPALTIALIVFVASGCESDKTSYALSYKLYDTSEQVIETGIWKFSVNPMGDISGSYMCNGDGSGQMVGHMSGNTLTLTINPDWADAGTFVQGTRQGDEWSGTWLYETIAGPKDGGRFTAQ